MADKGQKKIGLVKGRVIVPGFVGFRGWYWLPKAGDSLEAAARIMKWFRTIGMGWQDFRTCNANFEGARFGDDTLSGVYYKTMEDQSVGRSVLYQLARDSLQRRKSPVFTRKNKDDLYLPVEVTASYATDGFRATFGLVESLAPGENTHQSPGLVSKLGLVLEVIPSTRENGIDPTQRDVDGVFDALAFTARDRRRPITPDSF